LLASFDEDNTLISRLSDNHAERLSTFPAARYFEIGLKTSKLGFWAYEARPVRSVVDKTMILSNLFILFALASFAKEMPPFYICNNKNFSSKMKITLLTVGKTDVEWVRKGLDLYISRIGHYSPFQMNEIPELKNVSALTKEQIKEKEGELILKSLKSADEVILLDEKGKEFRSVEFAVFLQEKMSRSSRDIVFVIGGAYGFSEAVYDRAEGKISLSKMTFSHQMIRTIFAEQLYRAFTIIKGEPYHHE